MLRIIGGKFKGRLLDVPRGNIRPTSDKVRESLFNILSPDMLSGARFLDLFAGSGAVGIEALSRGAEFVTFIDADPMHIKKIRENLKLCGLLHHFETLCRDVMSILNKQKLSTLSYDIIFADPPYNFTKWDILLPKIITNVNMSHYGYMVVEHSSKVNLPVKIDEIALYRKYIYGDTTLTVYAKSKDK